MNMFIPSDLNFSISSIFSAYASLTALLVLLRSAKDLIPLPIQNYLQSLLDRWFTPISPQSVTIIVDERAGISNNEVFEAADTYLRTKITPVADRFKVHKTPRQKKVNVGVEKDLEVVEEFNNVEVKWRFVYEEAGDNRPEKRYYELNFNKKYKEIVLDEYFPFVLAKAKEIKDGDKVVKLYTRHISSNDDEGGYNCDWGSVNLDHPSTFETLALDPDMKKCIIDDMERFLRRKEYYKRVGKAWKRGYLLYGPPGTGKSSLVAAMANYLHFDVYDLELTSIYGDAELRRILLSTTNRSIILVEDIDCSAQMKDRESGEPDDNWNSNSNSKLTLSGVLNFIDGLWSSCGDERIIVFTTNHKDRLDPALLRPGRMDMHIHMSYCTFSGFKILASNYLGLKEDFNCRQYNEIEELLKNVNVTPAQLAEELMKNEDVDKALDGVVKFLKQKEIDVKDDDEKHVKDRNDSGTNEGSKEEEVQVEEQKEVKASKGEKKGLLFFRKKKRKSRGKDVHLDGETDEKDKEGKEKEL